MNATFNGMSMKRCGEERQVSRKTACCVRHEFISFIERTISCIAFLSQVEGDENYFYESYKDMINQIA